MNIAQLILPWSFLFSSIYPQPSTILSHLSCFFILALPKPQKLSASPALDVCVFRLCLCERILRVVTGRHMQLDEHLSVSSVFVCLWVGISIRK